MAKNNKRNMCIGTLQGGILIKKHYFMYEKTTLPISMTDLLLSNLKKVFMSFM